MPRPVVTRQDPNRITTNKPVGRVLSSMASAWDMTSYLKMLVYGKSGTGKTTFWSSFPGNIVAFICSGSSQPGELKSINTKEMRARITPVVVTESTQMAPAIKEISTSSFGVVVLDHISGLQDLILKEILGLEEIPTVKNWGIATQKEYGNCVTKTKEIVRALLSLNKHIVIIGQERDFGGDSEEGIINPIVGAEVMPSMLRWLNPACDYVVQTFIRPKMEGVKTKVGDKEITTTKRGKGVEYCLRTEPHDIYTTKFRIPKGRPLPEVIVDPTYDKIVKIIEG